MKVPFRPLLGRVKRVIIPPRRIPAQTLRRSLFRFGFICHATADSPAARHPDWRMVQTNWRRIAVDQFTLYTHPETRIARHTDNGQETVLLGDCFSASSACVIDPLSMLAAAGADEMAGVLHGLSGRFALITVRNGQARFWHDPFASRTIYYRDGGTFGVASHDELLAVAFGNRRRADMAAFLRSAWFGAMPMAHLPGDATLFDGLRILPANHAYDATQRRPVRYWPVQERRRGSHQEYFAAMDAWFESLGAGVQGRHPVVSITGGIDSRTIAAGFRYAGVPFRTVTWTSFNLQEWEREPVNAVVRYLNGQHDWVDESNDMINDAALIGVRNSGNYRSASQVTAGMSRLYGNDADSVFVRGHGAAPVRGGYQAVPGHYSPMSEASLGELTRLYLSEHHKVPPDKGVVALVENELGHFANVVNYDSIADLGYDPNDIFYWEHKQTNWIGAGFNSVDPALNSLLGFNSRPLAEAAYGLPDSVRFKKTVFHDVIKRYDSGLAAIYYR